MADLRTCPNCGLRHARGEDVDPCACCLLDGWAVGLGMAIRRFVRRAEVEMAQASIRKALNHCPFCDYGKKPCPSVRDGHAALSRLAALAMEGVE